MTDVRPAPTGDGAYRWAADVEVLDDGRLLLGGRPYRLLRLSAAGARVVRRWAAGGIEACSGAEASLVDRLVRAGLIDPWPVPVPGGSVDRVTVVIPVRDRPAELARCLAAVRRSRAAAVVVVDDGSIVPVTVDDPAVRVVRRATSGGPAAARNTGLAEVTTELVAFVDSDVDVTPGWLGPVLAHLVDARVALVAPRVRSGDPTGSAGERYEWSASPLDLGAAAGPVRPDAAVAYVPAAALVGRVTALRAIGGFDESLRVGEDVDLVWRLDGAGHSVRYEPRSVVRHASRATPAAWWRQRVGYGRSAALLDARHRGGVPPVRASGWSLAVVGLAAAGHPVAAVVTAAWTAVALDRRLRPLGVPPGRSARLVARGHVSAARQVGRAVVRPWLPVVVLAGSRSGRWRRVASVAWLGATVAAYRQRRPPIRFVPWAVRWTADEVAYTAGLWSGCVRARRWRPLLPALPLELFRIQTTPIPKS